MIALVFCGDLRYCPYINRYIERLEVSEKNYRVYFWNRSKLNLHMDDHYVYFNEGSDLSSSKVQKIFDFYKFRKWIIDQLIKNHHEKIIVLSTLTGVILGRELCGGKMDYIFDIRDYSYEHIIPFFRIEKKLIKNSTFTAISSPGFKEFLPKHQYVLAHNFNRNEIVSSKRMKKTDGAINFVWNGMIRFFEFQKRYLDALKNDPRFNVVFHGDGPESDRYQQYCEEHGFTNVVFSGPYNNKEKPIILANAHILNNCYGYTRGAGNKLKYAVSNRFYDGMIHHIPQLVEPEGFKPNWAKKSGLGVSFPPDKQFADKLYEYYRSIDEASFDAICERELQRVLADDDIYIKMVDDFIR